MNSSQLLVKIDDYEASYFQVDSKSPVLYVCPMCEHNTNSVGDLKQHLTEAHVDPHSIMDHVDPHSITAHEEPHLITAHVEPHSITPHVEPHSDTQTKVIKKEEQCENFQNEVFVLMNEEVELKVKGELIENFDKLSEDVNLLISSNTDITENQEKLVESSSTVKIEDLKVLNSYDQIYFIKTEDVSQAESYSFKKVHEKESHLDAIVDKNEDTNEYVLDDPLSELEQSEYRPKTTSQDEDTDLATCEFCSCKVERAMLSFHQMMLCENNNHCCPKCSLRLTTEQNLMMHLEKYHNQVDFKSSQCPKCQKSCTSISDLEKHLLTHTEEKPFKCLQCQRSFARSSTLNSHLKTHTGEKLFKCLQCSKSFTTEKELTLHFRYHTRDKLFKCSQCPKSFSWSSHLESHFLIHTGEKPFKCLQCQKTFNKSSNLRRHLSSHQAPVLP
jgi:uncharacterized C2H2 Zn-finger protein